MLAGGDRATACASRCVHGEVKVSLFVSFSTRMLPELLNGMFFFYKYVLYEICFKIHF